MEVTVKMVIAGTGSQSNVEGTSITLPITIYFQLCYMQSYTGWESQDTSQVIQIRQNAWTLSKPTLTYSSNCNAATDPELSNNNVQVPYDELLEVNPTGALGITINADYSFTILTTAAMIGQSSYEVKYTAWNRDTPVESIVYNEFKITITYVDNCGLTTLNSLVAFTVSNMETSVLRVNTEYPS